MSQLAFHASPYLQSFQREVTGGISSSFGPGQDATLSPGHLLKLNLPAPIGFFIHLGGRRHFEEKSVLSRKEGNRKEVQILAYAHAPN